MKNEKMNTLGIVNASPAEFAIHQRMEKIHHTGRGINFFKLPWIDRYTILPSSTRTIQFKADQITPENQGVEITIFEKTRSRTAEVYFNGSCLVRAVRIGRFEKVPSFLRHLWSALAE